MNAPFLCGKVVRASMARSVQVLGLSGMRDYLASADCEMELIDRFLCVRVGELHTAVPLENVLFLWLDTPSQPSEINVGQSVGTNPEPDPTPPAKKPRAQKPKKDAS